MLAAKRVEPRELFAGPSTTAGIGLFTKQFIEKGSRITEYRGLLIDNTEVEEHERKQIQRGEECYIFQFSWHRETLFIDGSWTDHVSKYINHSRHANVKAKLEGEKYPHIVLYARKDIMPGEELFLDYNDRRPEVLRNFPWLKK